MAHCIVVIDAHNEIHQEIIHNLESRKYTFNGESRSGYCIPTVSEVRMYQIRIKKECAPEMLRDLNATNLLTNPYGALDAMDGQHKVSWVKRKIISFGLWNLRKVMGLLGIYPIEAAKGTPNPLCNGYKYCFNVGKIVDIETVKGQEEL